MGLATCGIGFLVGMVVGIIVYFVALFLKWLINK